MENDHKKYLGLDTTDKTYVKVYRALEKPSSLVDISRSSGVDIKTAKRVVHPSVKTGHVRVETSKGDGRGRPSKLYSLTDMGRHLKEALEALIRSGKKEGFSIVAKTEN